MPKDPDRAHSSAAERPPRWLSWVTLLAGAVMCAIAALMS
jgi:hypothetical protein